MTIGERIGAADCTVPTCGLDWITTPQPVVLGEWEAQPPRRRRCARSPRSRAGAARSRRSSTRASPTGCACTSSAGSRSCRCARLAAVRGRARHPRGRDGGPRAAGRKRLAAGGPGAGGRRPVGLPRLRAGVEGRADGGQGHVREEPQRVGQRSQHLLPGQRPAGGGAGDRLLGALSGRGGTARLRRPRRAPRRPSRRSRPTTSATAAAARALAEEHFDSDRVLRRLLDELGIP